MYDLYLKIYCFLSANASRMDKILLQRIGTDLDTLVRVWGGTVSPRLKRYWFIQVLQDYFCHFCPDTLTFEKEFQNCVNRDTCRWDDHA